MRLPLGGAIDKGWQIKGELPVDKPLDLLFSDDFWRHSADLARMIGNITGSVLGGRGLGLREGDNTQDVRLFLDTGLFPVPTYPEMEIKLPQTLAAGDETTGPTKPESRPILRADDNTSLGQGPLLAQLDKRPPFFPDGQPIATPDKPEKK